MPGPADWVNALARPAFQPSDPEELRDHKRVFAVGLAATALVSLLWGLSYSLLGLFRARRGFRGLLYAHCAVNLLLPFVAQCLLGGLVSSGCLGLWAVVGPLTVLVHDLPRPGLWFAAFLGLQAAFLASDPLWAAHGHALDPDLARVFLMANLAGVLAALFFPLQYVHGMRRVLQERVHQQALGLAMEHAQTERLLHSILPEAVAAQLKARHGMVVQAFPWASVLFADIAGFTRYCAGLPPEDLVQMLNGVFCLFDALAEEFGLEKIKTIGDAYMVVGNLPQALEDHLAMMAEMALSMQQVFAAHACASQGLALRIGIHCGPVVAGVIGSKKFSYDLWGDTVNVASRLESHGEPRRIQVSADVYEGLKARYTFEDRGVVDLRGRGGVRAYWLLGRLPAVALAAALPSSSAGF